MKEPTRKKKVWLKEPTRKKGVVEGTNKKKRKCG